MTEYAQDEIIFDDDLDDSDYILDNEKEDALLADTEFEAEVVHSAQKKVSTNEVFHSEDSKQQIENGGDDDVLDLGIEDADIGETIEVALVNSVGTYECRTVTSSDDRKTAVVRKISTTVSANIDLNSEDEWKPTSTHMQTAEYVEEDNLIAPGTEDEKGVTLQNIIVTVDGNVMEQSKKMSDDEDEEDDKKIRFKTERSNILKLKRSTGRSGRKWDNIPDSLDDVIFPESDLLDPKNRSSRRHRKPEHSRRREDSRHRHVSRRKNEKRDNSESPQHLSVIIHDRTEQKIVTTNSQFISVISSSSDMAQHMEDESCVYNDYVDEQGGSWENYDNVNTDSANMDQMYSDENIGFDTSEQMVQQPLSYEQNILPPDHTMEPSYEPYPQQQAEVTEWNIQQPQRQNIQPQLFPPGVQEFPPPPLNQRFPGAQLEGLRSQQFSSPPVAQRFPPPNVHFPPPNSQQQFPPPRHLQPPFHHLRLLRPELHVRGPPILPGHHPPQIRLIQQPGLMLQPQHNIQPPALMQMHAPRPNMQPQNMQRHPLPMQQGHMQIAPQQGPPHPMHSEVGQQGPPIMQPRLQAGQGPHPMQQMLLRPPAQVPIFVPQHQLGQRPPAHLNPAFLFQQRPQNNVPPQQHLASGPPPRLNFAESYNSHHPEMQYNAMPLQQAPFPGGMMQPPHQQPPMLLQQVQSTQPSNDQFGQAHIMPSTSQHFSTIQSNTQFTEIHHSDSRRSSERVLKITTSSTKESQRSTRHNRDQYKDKNKGDTERMNPIYENRKRSSNSDVSNPKNKIMKKVDVGSQLMKKQLAPQIGLFKKVVSTTTTTVKKPDTIVDSKTQPRRLVVSNTSCIPLNATQNGVVIKRNTAVEIESIRQVAANLSALKPKMSLGERFANLKPATVSEEEPDAKWKDKHAGRLVIVASSGTTTQRVVNSSAEKSQKPTKVIVKNIASSTKSSQIKKAALSCGTIKKITWNSITPSQNEAEIVFNSLDEAKVFCSRYNRKMIDLSLITVSILSDS